MKDQGAFRSSRCRSHLLSGPSEIRPDNTRPRSVPGLPESRRRRRGRLNPDFVGKIVMLALSQHELKVFLLVARTKT